VRIFPGELQPYRYTVIDSTRFDVDQDGSPERLELLATVERNAQGELLWEDGHHWAVVVSDESVRYPIYQRFLPWGRARLIVLREDPTGRPVIVVHAETAARCPGEEQSLSISLERFTFDAARRAFVREAGVEAIGTGVCADGEGGA
jgi:hypothetical protein